MKHVVFLNENTSGLNLSTYSSMVYTLKAFPAQSKISGKKITKVIR